jgi:transcription antitermination factor NusG
VRLRDHHSIRLEVLRTAGSVRILGQGDRIEPVPEAEIESIRRLLKARVPCFAHPFLKEGAWVRVKSGPLRDVEGLLVRLKSKTRLVLSVALLSQSVATEIDVADVEVLRPAHHRVTI